MVKRISFENLTSEEKQSLRREYDSLAYLTVNKGLTKKALEEYKNGNEFYRMRVEAGLSLDEVMDEVGKSHQVVDNGSRPLKRQATQEKRWYEISNLIYRKEKERLNKSEQYSTEIEKKIEEKVQERKKKTTAIKGFLKGVGEKLKITSMEEEEDLDEIEEVPYPPVTKEILRKAGRILRKENRTIVSVALELEVCPYELGERLEYWGIKAEYGSDPSKLGLGLGKNESSEDPLLEELGLNVLSEEK